MSENINGSDILGSGGHVWIWHDRNRAIKVMATVGVGGQASMLLGAHGRLLTVAGAEGAPAVLKASSNANLTALEAVIEALCNSGSAVSWEDPEGRSGSALVLLSYRRLGHRHYGASGTPVWQFYRLEAMENSGGF